VEQPAGLYAEGRDRFWATHAGWPLLLFLLAFAGIEGLGLDRRLAAAWFFDQDAGRWLGSGAGDWWAHALLHDAGRWLVRGAASVALAVWAASFAVASLRPWRRPVGFAALAMVASVGIVGLLKAVTNVDCPWDLAGYGGTQPFVSLLGDRPDYLPRARCFPGAHASSGFALLCVYFAWRDHAPGFARIGLVGGVLVGCAFAVGQEARGAHFVSHDLAGAAVVWFVQLALYAWLLRPRRQRGSQPDARHAEGDHARGQATDDVSRPAQPQGRGDHAHQAWIERREIQRGAAVEQHVRHDDGRQRAHRRVTQRRLGAVPEADAVTEHQEGGARHQGR
jgi:membrane-associated PAP2 superfamily phosphatase